MTIGGIAATDVTVNGGGTSINALTPAHAIGAVSVIVTTPVGTATAAGTYLYVPPTPTVTSITPNSGTTLGGTAVTITGANFTGATSVTIGGAAATIVTVSSATTILATTPAHAPGPVSVVVTTPGGTGTGTNLFTYVTPLPTVSAISPISGTTAGGTPVTITGANLTGATAVTIGGVAATGVTVNGSGTSITATTPAHATGHRECGDHHAGRQQHSDGQLHLRPADRRRLRRSLPVAAPPWAAPPSRSPAPISPARPR